ncbi:Mitochondrial import inner membrane translocase subunit TIM9 [Rhodotorula sp. CCFEE 5036]|nr:Mitochondrial import inner membrane translocase subunit TIM9 [Rhodotorula sp. CCFEE 5036]
MNAANMNPATAQAFEGMMQQKQASPRSSSHLPPRPSTHLRAPSAQMKDFMSLYSNLVERCFLSCCQDFTSKALSSKEESCVMNCADKFLKHSERVGLRFSEQNAEMMARAGQR